MSLQLTNYWWLIIWAIVGGAFLSVKFPKRTEMVMGKEEVRWNIFPAILFVTPYIVWSADRGWFGDTSAYRSAFDSMPTTFSALSTYFSSISKDVGFYGSSAVLKIIFGESDVFYFFIFAAIQILCVALIYRKYSCNYWLSIFIFIASTDYMSWVWNGMRQFTAVALVFAATPWIFEKKYKKAIIMILIAAMMHQTALMMIPIIFIIQGEAWNKKTLWAIAGCILALLFVDRFTDVLDAVLADSQYTNVVSDWTNSTDDGTNPIRVLVYSIPLILAIVGRKIVKLENDPVINMVVNASVLTTGIYLVSMVTSGIFVGRLPIYVSLYANGILLPWAVENVFTKNSMKIVLGLTIVAYCAFFYYQVFKVGWY